MKYYFGHFIVLGIWAWGYVLLELFQGKMAKNSPKNNNTIWTEQILVVTLASFLPCIVLYMPSGNASYFSQVAPVFGIVFFLGQDYGTQLYERFKLKKICSIVGAFYCSVLLVFNSPVQGLMNNFKSNGTNVQDGIYEYAQQLKKMVDGREEDYTIFLDDDAEVARVYTNVRSQIFLYPGLTGVAVINASYLQNNQYYSFSGQEVFGYGFEETKQEKLTFEKAKVKARLQGKKYIIHMMKRQVEIIEL